ncbi:GNAT family N-acetyltransferase, partial [Klebsiella pneumoniae]|uniref:GNAT family N-acetyltransferase n=1 Tax=Klebsiella pneumoniae TaxID=573 RepID=UPI002159FD5F
PCRPVARLCITLPSDRRVQKNLTTTVRGCGVGKLLIEHALSLTPKLTTNVNEQNEQAVGFYQKMGFRVTGRSETDDLGQPYPLLNLMYEQQAEADYD